MNHTCTNSCRGDSCETCKCAKLTGTTPHQYHSRLVNHPHLFQTTTDHILSVRGHGPCLYLEHGCELQPRLYFVVQLGLSLQNNPYFFLDRWVIASWAMAQYRHSQKSLEHDDSYGGIEATIASEEANGG
jgi:hypothetical protein